MFSSLKSGLDAREEDLIQELTSIQQTAGMYLAEAIYLTPNVNLKVISPTSPTGMILQKRKDTASFLRQAAEKANTLEEAQVTELKHQIKVVIEPWFFFYSHVHTSIWRPCKLLKTLPTYPYFSSMSQTEKSFPKNCATYTNMYVIYGCHFVFSCNSNL